MGFNVNETLWVGFAGLADFNCRTLCTIIKHLFSQPYRGREINWTGMAWEDFMFHGRLQECEE